MPNDLTAAIAVLGAATGIFGAALSLINTWRAFDRDRVKIRVVPMIAFPVTGGVVGKEPLLSIEVTNLSTFPVTIAGVGYLMHGTKSRLAITSPIIHDGGAFPRRLEPRSTFSVYAVADTAREPQFAKVRCAYAQTACGCTIRGKSKALNSQVEEAQRG
jgi:hypothetical protein